MFKTLKRSGALYTHTHTHGCQQIYTIIKEVLFKCLFNFKNRGDKHLDLSRDKLC